MILTLCRTTVVCICGALLASSFAYGQQTDEQIHFRTLAIAQSLHRAKDVETISLLNYATDRATTLAEKVAEIPVKHLSAEQFQFTVCLSLAKSRIAEMQRRPDIEEMVRLRYMQLRTVSCVGHVAPQLISPELRSGLSRHAH